MSASVLRPNSPGIASSASDSPLSGGPFADYATAGVDNESLSLAIAGISGALVTLAVGFGMLGAARGARRKDRSAA